MPSLPSSYNYYLALGLGDIEADIAFGKPATGGSNKVVVFKGRDDQALTINQELVGQVSEDLAPLYPEGLELKLHSGVFIHGSRTSEPKSRKVVGVAFGAGFDLSKLPLVGKYIPTDQMIGFDNIQAIFSSTPWSRTETGELANMLPPSALKLPPYLNQGGNFSFAVKLGGAAPQYIALGATEAPSRGPAEAATRGPAEAATSDAPPPRPATQPGMTFWLDANKTMGPLTVRRIGARYYESRIHFMLDASLLIGPVTLSLEGLSAGTRLDRFDPVFNLDGIGLSYEKRGLQISGGLLRNAIDGSFSGRAFIKTTTLTLSALGAYQEINGNHSLFVYAVADRAVGAGPSAFEVTGVAAGFGYNRSVRIPEPENVGRFSLVNAAGLPGASTDPMTALRSMQNDLPATPGALFFVLGLKFNNYKIVNSVALLIVRLEQQVQVDVVGLSIVTVPVGATGKDIQANVEIGWTARYDADNGAIQVRGAVDPQKSFLFSRENKLSGQFAFYSWLTGPHAGDFVFTLGGYHPRFNPPAHYPNPSRLRFSWEIFRYKVDAGIIKGETSLNLSGSMYWALTPSAMMLGGILEARYRFRTEIGFDLTIFGIEIAAVSLAGEVDASLTANAHFLISWQPFSYDVEIGLDIRISASFTGRVRAIGGIDESVTKRFDLDLGADLHLWGPELSGRAHVDWTIISFDIAFGAGSEPDRKPLDWATFTSKFLPEKICAVALENGAIRQVDGSTWVVNGEELVLATHTVIPSTMAYAGAGTTTIAPTDQERIAPVGIAPMGIATVAGATHRVTVLNAKSNVDATGDFTYKAIKKSAPKAVWGPELQPGLDSAGLVSDMLMGVRIEPKKPAPPKATAFRPTSEFVYDLEQKDNAYEWRTAPPAGDKVSDTSLSELNATTTQTRRDALLEVLKLDTKSVKLGGNLRAAFWV